jgi:hypothetical protein
MSRASLVSIMLGLFVWIGVCAGRAHATTDCQFTFAGRAMSLQRDCTTDATILIPDGFTLVGNSHTITAVDPPGVFPNGFFSGAVVSNAGTRASVRTLNIDTRNLGVFCHVESTRLRGIWLNAASGEISQNTITNLAQRQLGCQEGNGIVAENLGAGVTQVFIHDNAVVAYEKIGIEVSGAVQAHVRNNAVVGVGPVDTIAQIGVRVGFGADGTVVAENQISGNSYTGTQNAPGVGVQVLGGPVAPACPLSPCPLVTEVRVDRNVLDANDVGVYLDNEVAAHTPPATPTGNLVRENSLAKATVTNALGTQVGIFDIGTGDRLVNNVVSGVGYDPFANPGKMTVPIFADQPFANGVVERGNTFTP